MKGKIIQSNLKALKIIYHHYPKTIISRLAYALWDAITPYISIYLTALLINQLISNPNRDELVRFILVILGIQAGMTFIKSILNRWQDAQNSSLYYQVEHILFSKLFTMDYSNLDNPQTVKLLSTIRDNSHMGGWGFERSLEFSEKTIYSFVSIIAGISLTISLFTTPIPLAATKYLFLNQPYVIVLVILGMIGLNLLSSFFFNQSESYWVKNSEFQRQHNNLFSFYGWLGLNRDKALDVRMYHQEKQCEKFCLDKTGMYCSKGTFAKYSRGPMGIYRGISSVMMILFSGIVYLYVGLKAWAGAFMLGNVTQYIASILKFASGFSTFVVSLIELKNNVRFLDLIYKFLDMPNLMYQGSLTVEKRNDNNYEVEFKNVSFKYPGSENYVLKNINMKFKIGEKLAIVGQNGSGKTTFIKLLCRLYDPSEGEILLNGINIKKYNYKEYMNIFSVVFQDFQLFALPLAQNVASSLKIDEDRVIQCLNQAGLQDRLKTMPQGIHTFLYKDLDESGVHVSGGEAQKIAIARALYKDAPFIILDEPTAALDPISESEIYSKFDTLVGERTAVYISHRLSSCKFCDEILVFDHGHLVQQGSHQQLVHDRDGMYYQLWQAQAQYYK